jgi:hypothetical protein
VKTLEVRTVPHATQRYDTVGDYQERDRGRLIAFTISTMPDWRSEAAVAVHEIVEFILVTRARIKLEVIDDWDMDHPDAEEPGDVPDCPYGLQHRFAENIERLVVAQLGLTWAQHEENCRGVATVGIRSGRPAGAKRGARGGSNGVDAGADRLVRDGSGEEAPRGVGAEPQEHGSVQGPERDLEGPG